MSPADGQFSQGDLRFVLDDGFAVVEFGATATDLEIDDLDARIPAPELGGAPFASFLLARLAHLTGPLGLDPDLVEHVEGGVWVLDYVVSSGEAVVAKVQLQGGMQGAGLLGVAADPDTARAVLEAFCAAVAAGAEVAACRVRIVDPDWRLDPAGFTPAPADDSVLEFGRDAAGGWLGAGNVRPVDGAGGRP